MDFFHTVYTFRNLIRIVGLVRNAADHLRGDRLLLGFFLPGDSLLITAGLFAARGDLNLPC
jgi:membrane protein DedA with SNARE-associated domain